MAQIDAWVTVVGSAVTGAAVLGSAALAQRATHTRDQNARLWQRRSEVYVEAVRWLQSLLDALPADDDASMPLIPDFSVPPLQFRAELAVYASSMVHHLVQSIVSDVTPTSRGIGSLWPRRWKVEGAIDTIRDELQGSNPLPYDREPTRRELFIYWLHSLTPSGIRLRLRIRQASRERIKTHGLSQFNFSTDRDEPDPLGDDNKRG